MYELILEAGRTEQNDWRRLWRYRELFYFLAWRDILVRYKQTVIGTARAVIKRAFLVSYTRSEYGSGILLGATCNV